ncbi:hypothetical protein F5876DRAFT_32663, partial [Lentinula aff. lateritia]
YFLPKGTICYANVWSIHLDENEYGDDTERFNLGRFLNDHGKLKSSIADTRDEGHVTYGFGKR